MELRDLYPINLQFCLGHCIFAVQLTNLNDYEYEKDFVFVSVLCKAGNEHDPSCTNP